MAALRRRGWPSVGGWQLTSHTRHPWCLPHFTRWKRGVSRNGWLATNLGCLEKEGLALDLEALHHRVLVRERVGRAVEGGDEHGLVEVEHAVVPPLLAQRSGNIYRVGALNCLISLGGQAPHVRPMGYGGCIVRAGATRLAQTSGNVCSLGWVRFIPWFRWAVRHHAYAP